MRTALPLMLLVTLLVAPAQAQAQDVRYVSDKQLIPLRSGAGNQYRVIHRGIPSGTRLTVARVSEDGVWAEITTAGGTSGWIRAQYLMIEVPAQNKLDAAIARADQAAQKSSALTRELAALKSRQSELLAQASDSEAQLGNVSSELAQLKQISGKAVKLDVDNRRLVVDTENLRSEVEMLKAENQRLEDKLDSEDFLNGALAVLMGVIIALVVPRLWPKRRKSSSWA